MKPRTIVKVLLVEDDDLLSEGLALTLRETGYTVEPIKNGLDATILLKNSHYDLVVLDLSLPGMDGIQVLKKLRSDGNGVPVLILSARDSLVDRVNGLNFGANDYLTKPFEVAELEARMRALLRLTFFANQQIIRCGNLSIDFNGRIAHLGDEDLNLSEREFIVLDALLKKATRVVSKTQLIDILFEKDIDLTFNALDIVVHRLRKKLDDASCTIQTLKGVGYVLKEQ
ncbi:unnamed protein product [Sphagnum jensenii]